MKQWRYSGGGDNDANRLPILSDCESLNLHYFSFVWRFNRKCVSQWLHVRVFACWKLRDNAPILIILRTKMIFYGEVVQPSPPHPTPLGAYGASRLYWNPKYATDMKSVDYIEMCRWLSQNFAVRLAVSCRRNKVKSISAVRRSVSSASSVRVLAADELTTWRHR